MTAYDCHYMDKQGNKRIFCCYARDVLQAQHTLTELVGDNLARIVRVLAVDNFDW